MDELPLDPGHPRALAARRLLSDETVQDFFRIVQDQLTIQSIQGPTIEVREGARHQVMAILGLRQTLEAFAVGQVPAEYRNEAPPPPPSAQPN